MLLRYKTWHNIHGYIPMIHSNVGSLFYFLKEDINSNPYCLTMCFNHHEQMHVSLQGELLMEKWTTLWYITT